MGEWCRPEADKTVVLKNERGKCMDTLCQDVGHSGHKPG